MSRSQFPLTPTMSGGFIVQDHQHSEVEASFALPPAAMGPIQSDNRGKMLSSSRKNSEISFVPVSPSSPEFAAVGRTKSNTSPHTGAKRGLDEFSLPPPPTRTRKIIQVKPKPQPISSRVSSSTTSTVASKSKDTSTTSSTKATGASSSSTSKKKQQQQQQQQPSSTSAAGRKIARKTAHSLIERRRRSKMNEEFSTLKNMIPACRGQEMHKLAILQASIEYVNYLEQCIADLKTASGLRSSKPESSSLSNAPSPSSPAMTTGQAEESRYNSSQDDSSASASASPELPPLSGTESAVFSPSFSPAFSPYNSLGQQQHSSRLTSAEFPPHMNNNHASGSSSHILPSPALGPNQSPLISWRRTSSIQLGSASQSPAMLPQQPQDPHYHHHHDHHQQLPPPLHRHSTSSYSTGGDAEIDHEASAALLMLNMDRRGIESATIPQAESASEPTLKATMTALSTHSTLPVILPRSRRPEESETDAVGRANTSFTTAPEPSDALPNRKRKKVGMSVRDLLVS